MKKCENCNTMFDDEFLFCPECGTKAESEKIDGATAPISKPAKKKMAKKTKMIIGWACAAAFIVSVVLIIYTSPRDITINSGKDIEVFVGDDFEIPVSADGLSESELQGIEWMAQDEDLIKIENGVMTASYDKRSFDATIDDTEGNGEEDCTYTSYIYADMEKGLKKWKGTAKVIVSLKPVEFESGKLIKEPADPRNSYIEITAASNYNTYFYFKSTTKPANDMSFLVKKGEKVTVEVPCDTYVYYEANGQTWYGSEMLFGPGTFYYKNPTEHKYTSDTYWEYEMESENGNATSEDIDATEFPE